MSDPTNPPPAGLSADQLVMLGRIDGTVQGVLHNQSAQLTVLQSLDARLRNQEIKTAKIGAFSGALSGSMVSIGIALIVEGLKNGFGRGGPTP